VSSSLLRDRDSDRLISENLLVDEGRGLPISGFMSRTVSHCDQIFEIALDLGLVRVCARGCAG